MTAEQRPWYLDGLGAFLGFRYEATDRIRLTIRPDLINAGGLLAGPVAFALIDYAMGSALWARTEHDEAIATINIAINYVASAREGDVVGTAVVDRRNRRNAVLRGEVHHEDGTLLATAVGSYAIFPRRTGAAPPPGVSQIVPGRAS